MLLRLLVCVRGKTLTIGEVRTTGKVDSECYPQFKHFDNQSKSPDFLYSTAQVGSQISIAG